MSPQSIELGAATIGAASGLVGFRGPARLRRRRRFSDLFPAAIGTAAAGGGEGGGAWLPIDVVEQARRRWRWAAGAGDGGYPVPLRW